jgi:hypothetical protein
MPGEHGWATKFVKLLTILIGSHGHSCDNDEASHLTLQGSIQNVSKRRVLRWNVAHSQSISPGFKRQWKKILCMAEPLRFPKTLAVLIASRSCASDKAAAGHHTLQGNIQNVFFKGSTLHWNGAQRDSVSNAVSFLCSGRMANPLQFSKTLAILIASQSYGNDKASHHTLHGSSQNGSNMRALYLLTHGAQGHSYKNTCWILFQEKLRTPQDTIKSKMN